MISRRSARAIGDAYHACYSFITGGYHSRPRKYNFRRNELHDFLYVNDFDAWFLNAAQKIASYDERGLREFVMKLHTGESVVSGTKEWPWSRRQKLGQRLLKELAEALLKARHEDPDFETAGEKRITAVDLMQRSLELDGYVYRNGVLHVTEAISLDEVEEPGLLITLSHECALPDTQVIKHHLDLSIEHYSAKRWDDSISNSRKVLESVLHGAAVSLMQQKGEPAGEEWLSRPARVRDYLERSGLVEKKEKETITSIYGLLSETGAHPYMAARDQARLTRSLALTISEFVLLRLRSM